VVTNMLNLKASVAAAVLAGTAIVSAGASYFVTKATAQATVSVSCPPPKTPPTESRGVPLGGPPLPTDQGKKW
jgi:hypothetical protein